jgi:hypothetical protein
LAVVDDGCRRNGGPDCGGERWQTRHATTQRDRTAALFPREAEGGLARNNRVPEPLWSP